MLKYLHQSYGTHGCDKGYRVFTIEATLEPDKELLVGHAGSVLDGSVLAKVAAVCKPGHVLKVLSHDDTVGTSTPTGYAYTCIAGTETLTNHGTERKLYAVCHKSNEHVKFITIDELGELDLTADDMPKFPQLVRMKRIGIVTLSALGGAGAQSFDVKDGSNTTAINRVDIAAAGQIGFGNNTPVGTFSEIACNYISNCVHIVHHGAAVAANAGNAVVYIVYDNETDVEVAMPAGASNATRSVIFISPQVYAKLIKVDKKITYTSGGLTGDNRFAVKNGANNATTPAALTAEWTPVADNNEIFKGDLISLAQTVVDTTNRQVAVTATLRFAPDV